MPKHQRSIYKKEMDRTEMMRLMRRGYTQLEIAARLGVSVSTVNNDWNAVKLELRASREGDALEYKQRLLDEIQEVKREAWDAWEKSKEDAEKLLEEEALSVKGPTSRSQKVREGKYGDPRLLQTVLNCIDAEADLNALRPPKTNVLPMPVIPWDALQGLVPPPAQLAGPSPQVIEGSVVRPTGESDPASNRGPGPDSIPASAITADSIEDRIIEMAEKAKALRQARLQEEAADGTLFPDVSTTSTGPADEDAIIDIPMTLEDSHP